jgi:hypothetical protein
MMCIYVNTWLICMRSIAVFTFRRKCSLGNAGLNVAVFTFLRKYAY